MVRQHRKRRSEKPSYIRFYCPVGHRDVALEELRFKIGWHHRGKPVTFDELRINQRTGESNPLLKSPLAVPGRLTASHNVQLLSALQQARCHETLQPVLPYCSCNGHDHRIELTLMDLILLTGDVSTGKTCYFYGLEDFFHQKYRGELAIDVDLRPISSLQIVKQGIRLLREKGELPPPTQLGEMREIRFTIRRDKRQNWPDRDVTLFSYDTPGEISNSLSKIEQHFAFSRHADHIIFFIDPHNVQSLVRLCTSNHSETPREFDDSFIALNRLIAFLEGAFPGREKLPMNLAIVVTKCDEFENYFSDDLRGQLSHVHQPFQKPDLNSLNLISDTFKRWLMDLDESQSLKPILPMANRFRNVGFFPVSGLGTRVYEDEIYVDASEKLNGAIIQEERSLDEESGSSTELERVDNEPVKKKITVYRLKGEFNPIYVDLPILWLYLQGKKGL